MCDSGLRYERFDDIRVVPLLNDLYRNEWRLFHNFFCPSVKLVSKDRIGSKTIRRHDAPKTPYQRIVESPHILEPIKQSLSKVLATLNPFVLRTIYGDKAEKDLLRYALRVRCNMSQCYPSPTCLR